MRMSLLLILWCISCGMIEIFMSELGWNTPWRCDLLLATVVVVGRFFPFYSGCCAFICIGLLKDGWAGMPIGFYILHTQGVWIWSRIMGEALSIWLVGLIGGFLWLVLSWGISGFLLVHDHPFTFSLSTWISYPIQCSITCGCLSFLVMVFFKDFVYHDRTLAPLS